MYLSWEYSRKFRNVENTQSVHLKYFYCSRWNKTNFDVVFIPRRTSIPMRFIPPPQKKKKNCQLASITDRGTISARIRTDEREKCSYGEGVETGRRENAVTEGRVEKRRGEGDVAEDGRRKKKTQMQGERGDGASGWYHVLNQTKRNVLGLHEGWSVTRAKLRGRKGRRGMERARERERDAESVKYGGPEKGCSSQQLPP